MLLQQIGSSVGASSVSKVSIPRAVGVVATLFRAFFFMLGYVVSIPRAVGVVATWWFCREYGVPTDTFQYRER